jgi:hypothetical protein
MKPDARVAKMVTVLATTLRQQESAIRAGDPSLRLIQRSPREMSQVRFHS